MALNLRLQNPNKTQVFSKITFEEFHHHKSLVSVDPISRIREAVFKKLFFQ
jgi:hypothetical protein